MNAINRRKLVTCGAALIASAAVSQQAFAQDFPTKTIRLVAPFPAGGPSDTAARAIAEGLTRVLGQPVIVENRPGAGAIVGSQAVLSQPADGYTLLMASNVIATGKWLYPSMTFDPMKEFRAVTGVFRSPHQVVVAPSFQGRGIQDLITAAKKSSPGMQYASSGSGTMPHLGTELFKDVAGIDMQPISYRGSAPALVAVISGEVPVYFDIEFSANAMLKSGRVRSLGVTALKRSPAFPDIPTLDEQGVKGFELYAWFGIVARTGTPDAVVARLNSAINQVMDTPEFQARLDTLGAQKVGGTTAAFQKMMNDDSTLWSGVIKKNGIRAE